MDNLGLIGQSNSPIKLSTSYMIGQCLNVKWSTSTVKIVHQLRFCTIHHLIESYSFIRSSQFHCYCFSFFWNLLLSMNKFYETWSIVKSFALFSYPCCWRFCWRLCFLTCAANVFADGSVFPTRAVDIFADGSHYQRTTKLQAAQALLADKLKSHGQILTKIAYLLI